MQTTFYQTSNYIQHTGNLVDLEEFRRRSALAQKDSLARQPEPVSPEELEPPEAQEASGFCPVVLTMSQPQRRQARRSRQAWTLDICASLAIVFMTLVFTLRVIL